MNEYDKTRVASLYAQAMSAATRYARRYQKQVFFNADPEILARFIKQRTVSRLLATRSYAKRDQIAQELLDRAYSYIHEGEQEAKLRALYDSIDKGQLKPRAAHVLWAIFEMSYSQGPNPITTYEDLLDLIYIKFGDETSTRTIGRELDVLEKAGIIRTTRGKRAG